MDTMSQIQQKARERAEMVRQIYRRKAARKIWRQAKQEKWSAYDLDLVLGSLGLDDLTQ